MIASAPCVPPPELLDEELLDDELLDDELPDEDELLELLLVLLPEEDDPLLELPDDDDDDEVDEPLLLEDELLLPAPGLALLSLLPAPQAANPKQAIDTNSSRGVGRMQSGSDDVQRDGAYSLIRCPRENVAIG